MDKETPQLYLFFLSLLLIDPGKSSDSWIFFHIEPIFSPSANNCCFSQPLRLLLALVLVLSHALLLVAGHVVDAERPAEQLRQTCQRQPELCN